MIWDDPTTQTATRAVGGSGCGSLLLPDVEGSA